MKMYTIYDATLGQYFSRIFMMHNDKQAMRMFQHAVCGGDKNMSAHPDDYTLYHIGIYEEQAGIPIGHDPVRVCTGMEAFQQGMSDRERLEDLQKQIEQLSKLPTAEEEEHAN